jgi:hypothetical protein
MNHWTAPLVFLLVCVACGTPPVPAEDDETSSPIERPEPMVDRRIPDSAFDDSACGAPGTLCNPDWGCTSDPNECGAHTALPDRTCRDFKSAADCDCCPFGDHCTRVADCGHPHPASLPLCNKAECQDACRHGAEAWESWCRDNTGGPNSRRLCWLACNAGLLSCLAFCDRFCS